MSIRFPSIRIESSFEGPPGAGEVAREGPREDGLDEGADIEPARDGGREPKSGIFGVVVEVSLRSGDPNLGDNFGRFPRNWLRHIWPIFGEGFRAEFRELLCRSLSRILYCVSNNSCGLWSPWRSTALGNRCSVSPNVWQ